MALDPEMKAKIDELMKANRGRRELSLDEAEKVVGGKDFPYSFNMGPYYIHDEESLDEFMDFISLVDKQFGRDVTVALLMEMFPSYDIQQDYLGAGLAGLYNCLYHIATNTLDKKGPFW